MNILKVISVNALAGAKKAHNAIKQPTKNKNSIEVIINQNKSIASLINKI
jgi:hypothetical protein